MTQDYGMFIQGELCDAANGQTFDTYNPATTEVIGKVAYAGEADVDKAVKAAHQANESGVWSGMPAAQRAHIMNTAANILESQAAELAALETQNNGKPINESSFIDVPMSIDCYRFYASAARVIQGQTVSGPGALNYTLKEPVGVCAQIIPWNFPLMMAAWKLGPALATGNSVVLKPAEQTPLTALKVAQAFKEAGLPDGVLNIVTGDGKTGQMLAQHPLVNKVAFTGSTAVGKEIMANAAKDLKRVTLELGGKSPNVVFDDADLEQAVNGALFAIYFNQGQICTAGSRLFVQEGIYDAFMEKLLAKVGQLNVGNPTEQTTQVGSLISKEQYDRVARYLQVGQDEGAKLAAGGELLKDKLNGYFIQPTVFTEVKNSMTIAQEEIFGPVLSVIRFKDEEEAVKLVNDIPYGLVSAVWSQNIKRAHNFAAKIKAGYVWINTYNILPAEAPFGGYKQSGFGRELGLQGLNAYLETKNVYVELNEASPVTGWYGF